MVTMRPEIKLLLEKQEAGGKLTLDEISTLMGYALELIRFIGKETEASIARLEEQFGHKLKHDKPSTI